MNDAARKSGATSHTFSALVKLATDAVLSAGYDVRVVAAQGQVFFDGESAREVQLAKGCAGDAIRDIALAGGRKLTQVRNRGSLSWRLDYSGTIRRGFAISLTEEERIAKIRGPESWLRANAMRGGK